MKIEGKALQMELDTGGISLPHLRVHLDQDLAWGGGDQKLNPSTVKLTTYTGRGGWRETTFLIGLRK